MKKTLLVFILFALLFSACNAKDRMSGSSEIPSSHSKNLLPLPTQVGSGEGPEPTKETNTNDFFREETELDYEMHVTCAAVRAPLFIKLAPFETTRIQTLAELNSFSEKANAVGYFFTNDALFNTKTFDEAISSYDETFFQKKSLFILNSGLLFPSSRVEICTIIRKPIPTLQDKDKKEDWYVVYDLKTEITTDFSGVRLVYYFFLEIDSDEMNVMNEIEAIQKLRYEESVNESGKPLSSEMTKEIKDRIALPCKARVFYTDALRYPAGLVPLTLLIKSRAELQRSVQFDESLYNFDRSVKEESTFRQAVAQYDEGYFNSKALILVRIRGNSDCEPALRVITRKIRDHEASLWRDFVYILFDRIPLSFLISPQTKEENQKLEQEYSERIPSEQVYTLLIEIDKEYVNEIRETDCFAAVIA